ncbi:MAG: hypothetical protein SOV58_05750 [Candidatus Enteromonas sp.]|nr:hypothetical protein [Candidatus Enteromonas sp.]
MEPWQVILLILMIAFFVYAIGLVFVAGHGLAFQKSLRIRLKALAIVMAEKQRLLKLQSDFLQEKGVAYGEGDAQTIFAIGGLDFSSLHYKDAKALLGKLGEAETRLNYLSQGVNGLSRDEDYQSLLRTIVENDHSIRRGTSAYNMDVAALNYWMSIPLLGWVNYLFGITRRDPIV